MQSRRWQHGSSGELDVFGATRYFAGRADCCATVAQPASERLAQAKVVIHDKRMADNFHGHDDDERFIGVHDRRHSQELERLANSTGKSKLAAFFGFMVSPSPGTSFRKRPPPTNTSGSAAAGDEPTKPKVSTLHEEEGTDDLIITSAGSMQLEHYGYAFDLGIATGDTRLQGVKVVRGTAGDDERWVVRCSPCWHQDEQHAVTFYAASSDGHLDQVEDEGEGENGANPGNWDSDSSSDLFDLDIE